ncbi:hypothetical protein CPC08DRAFT_771500 [Agrocybe pediades]|nr:hypothetical protein CPC08DRAFT_771500 [Agrocybe pediades]
MESAPGAPSLDEIPDIFVAHVASMPKSSTRYKLHAGRKIHYQAGALILELKRGPSDRHTLTPKSSPFAAQPLLDKATEDLWTYCSAYFACFREAESIVAMAASGKHWKWANIQRHQVPGWDFATDTPKDTPSYDYFHLLFGGEIRTFDLGTAKSDSELMKMYLEHLYPMHAKVPESVRNTAPEAEDLEDNEEEFVESGSDNEDFF